MVFNGFGASLLLAPIALWRSRGFNSALVTMTGLGLTVLTVMYLFPNTHWLEWLPACVFLGVPPLVALLHRRCRFAERHDAWEGPWTMLGDAS